MSPNKMRFIDRWVGIPVSFFASLILILNRKFFPYSNITSPDTILFTCIAEMGALFVSHPAVISAKNKFPETRILFITGSGGGEVLKIMGFNEDDIFEINTNSFSTILKDCYRIKKEFKQFKNVYNIVLEPFTRFSHLIGFWLGVDRMSGCHPFNAEGGYLGNLITHPVIYNPHLHASQQFVSLVEGISNIKGEEPSSKIKIFNQTRNRARFKALSQEKLVLKEKILQICPPLKNKKWIILNCNASDIVPLRKWPLSRFSEVGKRLLNYKNELGIILTGTKSERKACEILIKKLDSSKALNLAGQTSFRELLILYDMSLLLISNDSGPVHFASSTNIKILALFGPENPSIFGPLSPKSKNLYLNLSCSPCVSPLNQKKSECSDNICMKSITSDWVYNEAIKLIDS